MEHSTNKRLSWGGHLLPFLHSLTGCDSTSRLIGIGKGIALKRLIQEYLKAQGQLFMNTTSSKLDVIKAGEEALTCVYGGLPLEGLDILRWRKFTAKYIGACEKFTSYI